LLAAATTLDSAATLRWDLREARLQLRPYSDPLFDIAVPAIASPTGAKLAGRHGLGLLSIGATTAAGFDALALHWDIMEAEAAHHGTRVDRSKWRLVGMVHCAESVEQAERDVQYGIEQFFQYLQSVAAYPRMVLPGATVKEMIATVNDTGLGAIGTPDMCTAQVARLMDQSRGGFGAYLMLAHNWANPEATRRSFELVAREVFPRFQVQSRPTLDATDRAQASRDELMSMHVAALETATRRYQAELGDRLRSTRGHD
jgi:limonene 1,2-monooxygenase